MKRKILFLIRGKLGDSLVAYSVFHTYVERHPEDDITLVIRTNYAELVRGERGFHLIPYKSRFQIMAWFLLQRLLGKRYDVFAVLWGFGDVLLTLSRICNAERKIYLDDRYAETFKEFPVDGRDLRQVDPAWRVGALVDPELPRPEILLIKSLVEKRNQNRLRSAIGICPLADEKRRNMDSHALSALLRHLNHHHPGIPLHVFLNPGEETIMPEDAPVQARACIFKSLGELTDHYCELSAWYGTDTGLYHLAAAMGIPCAIIFGPTQPQKTIMPAQPTLGIRLDTLADSHCDEKNCQYAACLSLAIQNFTGLDTHTKLELAGHECPLKAIEGKNLSINRMHRFPLHQHPGAVTTVRLTKE